MFRKGTLVAEDRRAQLLQLSAVTQPSAMLHPSETISSIGSEMAVVGKIIGKGVLKIYDLVEGEVIASDVLVADGAQIQGDVVAQELIIAGHLSLRVKLQATAVVEGEISHRSLSIGEDAWFEGRLAGDNPSESLTSQAWAQVLVAFDDQRGL